jgi:hypothetical protein
MYHAWEKRNTYRILMGKPEGKRPVGTYRRRWGDNIETDLAERGWGVHQLDSVASSSENGFHKMLGNS